MLKKIIGFSVLMMFLSIFAAQSESNAYMVDPDGGCSIVPGCMEAWTESGGSLKDGIVDYLSVTCSGYYDNGSVGPVSEENYNAIAVVAIIDTPSEFAAPHGTVNGSHYISDGGDTWSGTSSASY
jgi:hypothetical protein